MLKQFAKAVRGVLPAKVRRFVHRAGVFFAGDSAVQFPSMEASLLILKKQGFAPKLAVDVGAFYGEWTVMFKSLFPDVAVVMVEAQEGMADQLSAVSKRFGGSVEAHIALLGAEEGRTVTFWEMGAGSAVFPERSHFPRRSVSLTTTTLDRLIDPVRRVVDFIKLDVQGYELEVLRGGVESMRAAKAVLMEVSLLPINEGCPLVSDVVRFMDGEGFRLVDFCSQLRRTDGVLWVSDLLFVRVDSGLLAEPVLTPATWR